MGGDVSPMRCARLLAGAPRSGDTQSVFDQPDAPKFDQPDAPKGDTTAMSSGRGNGLFFSVWHTDIRS